ncbi:unnamed protein product [Albugo candida]|nr:unnamed protein product [Albugo candida]|eukprot:CCI45644.1 unnamed protein product [Albugo candida]
MFIGDNSVESAKGEAESLSEERQIINEIIETLEIGCRTGGGDHLCDYEARHTEELYPGNREQISIDSEAVVTSDRLLNVEVFEPAALNREERVLYSSKAEDEQRSDEHESLLIDFDEELIQSENLENLRECIERGRQDELIACSAFAFGSEEGWIAEAHRSGNLNDDSEQIRELPAEDERAFDAYAFNADCEFEESQNVKTFSPGESDLTHSHSEDLKEVILDNAYVQDDCDDFGDFEQCSSFKDSDEFGSYDRSSSSIPPFGEFQEEDSLPNRDLDTKNQAKWEQFYASLPYIHNHLDELISTEKVQVKSGSASELKTFEVSEIQESLICPPTITKIFKSRLDIIWSSQATENVSDVSASYLRLLHLILLDKIQDALKYKQDGSTVLTADTEAHMVYLNIAQSAQDLLNQQGASTKDLLEEIRVVEEAATRLQFLLFEQTMHEGIMRIAKDAALSAEAKIAEQFAQQQSTSRPSSVLLAPFHSTRQLLSRGQLHTKESGDEKSNSTCAIDKRTNSTDHLTQTPTGVCVKNGSQFMSPGTEIMGNGREDEHSNVTSTEEQSEDESDGSSLSSTGSRSRNQFSKDSAPYSSSTTSNTTSSGCNGSSTHTGSGGLMRKLASSLLSSATHSSVLHERARRRCVSLRAMTLSGSDPKICTIEIDLDAINGGFDEVKWKCAGFLYDFEEVAHIAPSQIKVWAYPSQQLLTAKSEKSLLSKFFKSHAVWTIDIGASSQCMDGVIQ